MQELTDNVEMLTLDKEQYLLENEMLQVMMLSSSYCHIFFNLVSIIGVFEFPQDRGEIDTIQPLELGLDTAIQLESFRSSIAD